MRSLSMKGFAAMKSAALIVSSYGIVIQSGLMLSVKSLPKPLEPWKLCQVTT